MEKDLTVEVKNGVKRKVCVTCNDTVNILIPKTSKEEITRNTQWNTDISAPIKKGDVLGYVNVYVGQEQVGRLPIVANEDIERLNLWVTIKWILNGLFSL